MTATRVYGETFMQGYDAVKPAASAASGQVYCSIDTGNSFYSDGVVWHLVAAVSPGGPGSGTSIRLDYDTGNASQWRFVQVAQTYSLTFVDTLRRIPSGFAGRYEVRPGDDPLHLGTGTERAEVLGPVFNEGDEMWYGWSTWFPDNNPVGEFIDFTIGTSMTNTFMDFHDNKGTNNQFSSTTDLPPFEMNVNTNDISNIKVRLRVVGGQQVNNVHVTPPTFYDLMNPILYNQWNDWIIHIKHSSDPLVGGFEMWLNGVRPDSVPSWQTLATFYQDRNSYLKQGWYRTANASTSVVYHDMGITGTSYAEVDPARFD